MEILYIIIGVVVGLAIGYLFANNKTSQLQAKLDVLQDSTAKQLAESDVRLAEQKTSYERRLMEEKAEFEQRFNAEKTEFEQRFNAEKVESERRIVEEKAENESHYQKALELQQARFDETIAKVEAQMRSATSEMLQQRQKEFAETSNQSLGQIVGPLRETIDKMKEAMNDSTLKTTAMSSEMKANIEIMMRQSEAARLSTEELTRVFKFGNKAQGDWGEAVLDEILQSQGLTRGVHYDTQFTLRDAKGNLLKADDGSQMRPDVILHLDQKREVIIDSKVSLSAFIDYVNAENDADKQRFLKAHIDSIENHVRGLSAKDYSSYIVAPKVKMDYVIMFMPNTGALWTALNKKPDLWRKAMEKNVFIADEQTLFAALRIINMTWTQIAQAQNHEKVFALANEMLDRVGQFMKKYSALGKALENAQKAYEDGERKLQPQGQSILQTAGKLIKLGAKQSEKNPLPRLEDEGEETPQIE